MRTHSLFQSSLLLSEVLDSTPIEVDVSLCLPRHKNLSAVFFYRGGKSLLRIPYYWEDDVEMESPEPRWHLTDECDPPGLRVFDFHPIHVYCNSPSLAAYSRLKRTVGLSNLTASTAGNNIHPGEGTQTFFRQLINMLRERGDSVRITDIARMCSASGS